MGKSIGVVLTGRVAAGVVEDHQPCTAVHYYQEDAETTDTLIDIPQEGLIELVRDQVMACASEAGTVDAVGIALPGIVRNGVVEDSPNLQQLKGARIGARVAAALQKTGLHAPVTIVNDADGIAAGVAATMGRLDNIIRVWSLGYGIGYGRYPYVEGVWEGGHCVVTMDAKETYCGCGGRGHLEGIMGQRAMRLRFLDMEPEEVFAAAKAGDERCVAFARLWHRGLAAATANAIHLDGPGRFYFTGFNVRFLDLKLMHHYLQQMVKMSPLQSYMLEIIPMSDELAVTGAAVTAAQAAGF
ncbi:MAG TPA: ROK family protein [Acidobacteriaceae bacterium]|jgi:predicted NBD/HSP70 family sugar kinase|nr:ROK family protein [Acidobacteriaceae bacterium]